MRGGRWLRALERGGAPEVEHAARFGEALAAGLQGEEDYLAVYLARLDALRRRGPPALADLRSTFQCGTRNIGVVQLTDYVVHQLRRDRLSLCHVPSRASAA